VEVSRTRRMPTTTGAVPVRTERCRPRRQGVQPVAAREVRHDGAAERYACGRMPRCAVLPRGMRQPREAVYTARYEALAGNPPRRPRGVVAGAHVRILDHVRRGSRPRCHFDRAPGCGCERPAQRSCSGESAQYRRCARHAFGWSRSLPSSTRGSSRARCIGSSAKAAGPAPSAHSRLRPSRSRDLAAATARAPA
jgi:hypothetical protein